MKKFILLSIITISLFQSCSLDTPKNYFDRTTLNTNRLRSFGSMELNSMIERKESGSLTVYEDKKFVKTESLEEYVNKYTIPTLKEQLQKVSNLKVTDDTKVMIDASLKIWNFAKEKYLTEYIEIAKLVDQEGNSENVKALIVEFDKENLPKLNLLFQDLMEAEIPYAKENGINVNSY